MNKNFFAIATGLAISATGSFVDRASAMEVAFEHDASIPLVYLNVAVKAGAVNDPSGSHGLTNFMGEMLLRGTKTHTEEQIGLELDQMGARLEVETRAEAMILRGAVISSQLEPFLGLVTELLTQSNFPDVEIKKLKSQVSSGILEELSHDPGLASRRFLPFLFRDHPYGNSILGSIADIKSMTREQIQSQYDKLVQDRYLLVVGAGDASSSMIEGWAKALAALRPSVEGAPALPELVAPENAPTRRMQIIDKPDRTQTQINVGQIGVKMTDPRFMALHVGNHAFGGGSFSARLMVEVRVKRGWSYGAGSNFRQGTQPRSWQAHLFPASKDTVNALALTLKMIEDLRTSGLTQDEFSFAQQSLVNSVGFTFNTPKKRVENKLLERTLGLPDGFMKSFGPKMSSLTLADVNGALKDFLKPDQLAVSVLATAKDLKAPLATAAGVPLDQVEITPYTKE